MSDFLIFFNWLIRRFPLHLEILYNKTCDWSILIYKKNMAQDYPNAKHDENDVIVVYEIDGDMELCFAKAHVALKEWMNKFNDEY